MIFGDSPKVEGDPKPHDGSCVWTLEFDGNCVVVGFGVGVVLISPKGKIDHYTYNLEFKNTNNKVEYEALLLAVATAKGKGVVILRALEDVELIVKQV